MSNFEKVMSKKEIFGCSIADLAGILLMVVPVAISIFWRREKNIFEKVWAVVSKQDTYYSIAPRGIIPLIACILFLALVVRYDFFKKEKLSEIIVSSVRAFLDIWALSSFLMIFFPQRSKTDIELLVMVILFTWLGMKSIAGYGWLILILVGIGNASKMLDMLGNLWPVFIITITISLLLQVKDVANIKNFFQEFNGKASIVRKDVNVSVDNAGSSIKKISKQVGKTDFAKNIFSNVNNDNED